MSAVSRVSLKKPPDCLIFNVRSFESDDRVLSAIVIEEVETLETIYGLAATNR